MGITGLLVESHNLEVPAFDPGDSAHARSVGVHDVHPVGDSRQQRPAAFFLVLFHVMPSPQAANSVACPLVPKAVRRSAWQE
jgi:hypothetical protein